MNFTDQKDAETIDELQKIIDSFIKKEEEYGIFHIPSKILYTFQMTNPETSLSFEEM